MDGLRCTLMIFNALDYPGPSIRKLALKICLNYILLIFSVLWHVLRGPMEAYALSTAHALYRSALLLPNPRQYHTECAF